MQERRLSRSRHAAAIVVSAVVVVSSPVVGDVRAALFRAFPSTFRSIVGSATVLAVAFVVGVAMVKIRDRRRWRFAAMLAGTGVATLYARVVSTGVALVDVVEHVHFVEYGIVAWLFYRAWRPLDNGAAIVWPLLAGTLVGIADESLQAFVPGRVGEAHDIFLNVVAVGCGLCFAGAFDPPSRLTVPLERSIVRPIGYGVSAVVVAFAAFFNAVHLGHAVYEPEIGLFWSHYDAAALMAASAERSLRWRMHPPLQMRRFSREDQYLSEAMWHVQERNRAWGAGDPFTAWRENLILERYFSPALDTGSFAWPTPPRWPATQRDATAVRLASDPGIYVSRAAPYPIYAWSPAAFWSGVVLVVAAVITAC